ncbi:MAG TPA: hypothetical protein VLE20_01830 [Blastocatellia bacterium]|nr:hypothetical protein [Blastocatellia bacterium]
MGVSGGVAMAKEEKAVEEAVALFSRAKFDRSTVIDNKYFPLKPGTRQVYKGSTQEGNERVPHRIVWTVTDLVKDINGVRAVVVWDRDFSADKLIESELVFFAQDNDGNVWHLGQIRETYDELELVGGRAWLAGSEGAKPGIMMLADPSSVKRTYSQGYAPPPFNWTDVARVDKLGQKTCVKTGCYKDVLVIAEGSTEEGPDAEQLKYHAPGVGFVRVGWRGKREKSRETLELTEIGTLDEKGLAEARAEAREIEKRAYIYGRTAPAELRPLAQTQ